MERRPDRFTVILDANALVGGLTRNILLHLGEAGYFRPRWSPKIIDETEQALKKSGKCDRYIERLVQIMCSAFPEANVRDYKRYEANIDEMPDPGDRHVVAAAIKCDASIIVTENLKDFPRELMDKLGIEIMTADWFIADLIDLDQADAIDTLERMRRGFDSPAFTSSELVSRMAKIG